MSMTNVTNIVKQTTRYGLVGVPTIATVGSAVVACCNTAAVNPLALLALIGGAALFVATGGKKK